MNNQPNKQDHKSEKGQKQQAQGPSSAKPKQDAKSAQDSGKKHS